VAELVEGTSLLTRQGFTPLASSNLAVSADSKMSPALAGHFCSAETSKTPACLTGEIRRPQRCLTSESNREGRAASPTRGDEEELVAELLVSTQEIKYRSDPITYVTCVI
jgi:hypothetical protein